MIRYKVIVQYDGHNYNGWQRVTNGIGIQQVIEDILSSITKETITIIGSGRTDALVHAYGQVFHFDTNLDIENYRFKDAINALLPNDIYIIDINRVDNSFHARFNSKYKVYQYHINNSQYNPLLFNYTLYIKDQLDIDIMIKASKLFIGTIDYTSFCATSLSTHPNQVRTIEYIDFIIDGDIMIIEFKGDGFLRYMVRMIVATLIQVGLYKIDINDINNMINAKDKEVCKYNVSARGLYLKEVIYNG